MTTTKITNSSKNKICQALVYPLKVYKLKAKYKGTCQQRTSTIVINNKYLGLYFNDKQPVNYLFRILSV